MQLQVFAMENKNQQLPIYTLGIWVIKPGKEAAFIDEWTSFAHWMKEYTPGVGQGKLLQDAQNPSRFISMGPWEDMKSIQAWRESEEFKAFVGKAQALCDDFQP